MDLKTAYDFPLIICPSEFKRAYLATRGSMLGAPQRLYSKQELYQGLYYSYDERAIINLMRTYEYDYDFASKHLADSYFVNLELSKTPRTITLLREKEELDELNLLTKNPYFKQGFAGKRAFVIGYVHEDIELASVAKNLGLDLVFPPTPNIYEREAYKYQSLEEEVDGFFNRVAALLDQGVSINRIKLICSNPDFNRHLLIASNHFHIPINLTNSSPWLYTPLAKRAIRLVSEGLDVDSIIEQMVTQYNLSATHPVINVLSRIKNMEPDRFRNAYVRDLLGRTFIEPRRFREAIEQLDIPFAGDDDDYVFILGMNQGVIPAVYQDIDYLTDREKTMVGMVTSTIKNKREEHIWTQFLMTHPRLWVSYHILGNEGKIYISPLLTRLGFKVVEPLLIDTEYGNVHAAVKLATMKDRYRIYRYQDRRLSPYQDALDIPYMSYDYRYIPFDTSMDEKMITLSHTSLKTFYQCRFKYYAQYVLGLSDDQDNFFIKYGRYAHQIIEIHDRRLEEGQPFDFDDVSSEIFKDYDFSPKEKTLLNHLHEDLRRLLDFNDEHRATMNSPTSIVESRYRYELDEKTSIIGRIDKIVMTRKDDKQYVSIIDYKTNDEAFDKSKLPYGYSMQLPLYSLLVANDPSFTDAQIIGYYIQNIAPKDFLKKPGQTIDQLYQRQLRLNGLSIDDIGVLSSFDGSLLDNSSSRFIKSLAFKSDGGFRYPKRVADYDKFEQYKSTVLEHARSANSAIRTNDFTINPKQLGKTDYSCKYCPFRDLCFRPDRAVEFIKLDDEEDSDEPELE